jgi:hypothetical protein
MGVFRKEKIKKDGTQRKKLTGYSVNSFAPFENQLLIINALYTLTVSLQTSEVSSSSILADGINDYYPTDAGIFV